MGRRSDPLKPIKDQIKNLKKDEEELVKSMEYADDEVEREKLWKKVKSTKKEVREARLRLIWQEERLKRVKNKGKNTQK